MSTTSNPPDSREVTSAAKPDPASMVHWTAALINERGERVPRHLIAYAIGAAFPFEYLRHAKGWPKGAAYPVWVPQQLLDVIREVQLRPPPSTGQRVVAVETGTAGKTMTTAKTVKNAKTAKTGKGKGKTGKTRKGKTETTETTETTESKGHPAAPATADDAEPSGRPR
ncbi:hypothetical protein C8T65DRAFT_734999 [Cerioporus squamosus]|nr:hypothetical protein C8T65DRAFT_734999 [Cerioporus squamosus]